MVKEPTLQAGQRCPRTPWWNVLTTERTMSAQSTMCVSFLEPEGSGAKVFFNLAYSLPTLAFLVFLTMRLKSALRRLSRSQSQIMRTYYSFLWVVCALSLFRCIFQIAESTSGGGLRGCLPVVHHGFFELDAEKIANRTHVVFG